MNNITFSMSEYEGFEDKVLLVRNNNRPEMVSRTYLDWRYLNDNAPPSLIFWVHQSDGTCVGMSSLIFRRFWVNNDAQDFAVMGDFSMNSELRGKGISKELIKYINSYIEKHNYISFGMPNYIASKSLSSIGWVTKESYVSYVYLIDPTERILKHIKNQKIAKIAGNLFRKIIQFRNSFKNINNYSMECPDKFDESFDILWQDIPKEGLILRDRSLSSLSWRYENHPYQKYIIVKFMKDNQFIGYLIYIINNDSICSVYDIIAKEKDDIYPMLSLFLKYQLNNKKINIIRIMINDGNHYSDVLRKSGFIKRAEDNIFQIYAASSNLKLLDKHSWFSTAGDKDV
jgi:hypothetical protein